MVVGDECNKLKEVELSGVPLRNDFHEFGCNLWLTCHISAIIHSFDNVFYPQICNRPAGLSDISEKS